MSIVLFVLLCLTASTFLPKSKSLRFPQEIFNFSSNNITVADNSGSLPFPPISPYPSLTNPPISLPLAPALFVIGDSSVDCGNNSYLNTLARADHPPYGRDFDTHQPTGRFCNGRIPVDYLALRLDLPFVPSYMSVSGRFQDMIQGVNFASAGAGIIFSTGSELGQHISLNQQIEQFTDTTQQFVLNLGEDRAYELVSNSVMYISVGINDYIHYHLLNASNVHNQFLASSLRQQIKNLYNLNVRKMVIMGLAPIGCAPFYLWKFNSSNGECVKDINNMIMEFNFSLRSMISYLNEEIPGANMTFCDVFEGLMNIIKNHTRTWF